ncbi:MAG: acetyl-CoA carboxylase, carboxyltransferase subunit beta [Chlamydiia bacterium]
MPSYSRMRPQLAEGSKQRSFDGWSGCEGCSNLIPTDEFQARWGVCPYCQHHHRLRATERLALLLDEGSFAPQFEELQSRNPLQFVDLEPYDRRLVSAKKKSALSEAVLVGEGKLHGMQIAVACMDFAFLGGSMGTVVGERIARIIEVAIEKRLPLLVITASGGARMQEGIFALYQMAKTTAVLQRFAAAKLPYISLLTDPTSGGVTASFATLADVILAEPGALICFTGPRVIEQAMGCILPKGVQRAEFLLERGMIDAIVMRAQQKETLHRILRYLA